jgi:hypothetical protein
VKGDVSLKILSIEPTPSPNVMKLNMSESLPAGISQNFSINTKENAPEYIKRLLNIKGIQGIFQVSDFIAIERHPKANWKEVLAEAESIFGTETSLLDERKLTPEVAFGEVQVLVQTLKGIPMQIKLVANSEEKRFGLPERFGKAIMKVQSASQNLIFDRQWEEKGVRYGTFSEVGEEVIEEIGAAYDENRLGILILLATDDSNKKAEDERTISAKQVEELLDHPEWEKRFAALEKINPTRGDIPVLSKALKDTKVSIRRLATVYLGMINEPEVLPLLYKALKDSSTVVRRTAGDALSDIGDPLAIGPMTESLKDPNKLVRWRAARFLFEVGDASAIDALRETQDDPEFEVSLQAKMALERIERGEAASGTVWQQMTRNIDK